MICKDCKNFKKVIKLRQPYNKKDVVKCGMSKHSLIDFNVLKICKYYKKDKLYKLKIWRKIKKTIK